MPVYSVIFKEAVRNEFRYTADDPNRDRRAIMTLTAAGLLLEQPNRRPILSTDLKYVEIELGIDAVSNVNK